MSKFVVTCLSLATFAASPLTYAAPPASPAKPAEADAFSGPALPGICLLSREAVVTNAKVGVAATARLKDLTDGVNAELTPERTAIEAEAKAIQDAKLTGEAQKTRQQALGQRLQALQLKAQQREQQIELTRQKALAVISNDVQPIIEASYKAQGCGVLFNRAAVMAGGQSMDLTPVVVKALDAKKTSLTFDLEPLPQPATPNAK
jgi:Skp family chaperone for outer membrane proteins